MIRINHTHRPSSSIEAKRAEAASTRCYTGPVRYDSRANPAAYGGVSFLQTCSCGAQRAVNASGGHRELGAWQVES